MAPSGTGTPSTIGKLQKFPVALSKFSSLYQFSVSHLPNISPSLPNILLPPPPPSPHSPSPSKGLRGSGFDLWFTWCNLCRHGGHSIHILDWFEAHSECPVSNCHCHCRQKESYANIMKQEVVDGVGQFESESSEGESDLFLEEK